MYSISDFINKENTSKKRTWINTKAELRQCVCIIDTHFLDLDHCPTTFQPLTSLLSHSLKSMNLLPVSKPNNRLILTSNSMFLNSGSIPEGREIVFVLAQTPPERYLCFTWSGQRHFIFSSWIRILVRTKRV